MCEISTYLFGFLGSINGASRYSYIPNLSHWRISDRVFELVQTQGLRSVSKILCLYIVMGVALARSNAP